MDCSKKVVFMNLSNTMHGIRVALVTLVFIALIAEGAVRLLAPDNVDVCGLYISDPVNHFAHKPSYSQHVSSKEYSITISTDGLGHRNPEGKYAEPASKRILFLGDSFTLGIGSEEQQSFPRLVENTLRERGKDVIVYNGATIGHGTRHELNELKRLAPTFRPTLVVIGYFANDPSDDNRFEDFEVYASCLAFKNEKYRDVKNLLRQNSAGYNFFSQVIRGLLAGPTVQQNNTKTAEHFKEIKQFAAGQGAEVMFVIIPNIAGRTELEGSDLSELNVLSLTNKLNSTLYYSWDRHLKPAGNGIVAQSIVEKMESDGYV